MTGPTSWKLRFLMAFEIVSDRGVLAGIVLPSPAKTRSLITGLSSDRRHDKTGAWEMHTDLSDRGIAASDDDLMDARGDQLADDRVASGIIRRDADDLARVPAVMQDDISHRDGPRFWMIVPVDIKWSWAVSSWQGRHKLLG